MSDKNCTGLASFSSCDIADNEQKKKIKHFWEIFLLWVKVISPIKFWKECNKILINVKYWENNLLYIW